MPYSSSVLEDVDLLKSIWGSNSDVPFTGFSHKAICEKQSQAKETIEWRREIIDMFNFDEINLAGIQIADPIGK